MNKCPVRAEQNPDHPLAARTFDPFQDRVARNIRNALSEAFIEGWLGQGPDYESRAAKLYKCHAHPVYRNYIDRRLAGYRAAIEDRRKIDSRDLMDDMIVLWNRELFFEVHELLESHWHATRGTARELLKTLIQAAGVYIHRDAGRVETAASMGRRVSVRLAELAPQMPAIRNLESLCKALAEPGGQPPRLERRRR